MLFAAAPRVAPSNLSWSVYCTPIRALNHGQKDGAPCIPIGNFGDGHIDVLDSQGHPVDRLEDNHGKPLSIDGLWTLTLGGGAMSSSDTLCFTAGPNGETDARFGTITSQAAAGSLAAAH